MFNTKSRNNLLEKNHVNILFLFIKCLCYIYYSFVISDYVFLNKRRILFTHAIRKSLFVFWQLTNGL